jgi:serine/threonine protein phosphatase PrpC
MGATVVAAWLDKNRLSLVNVGDSRAYLLHSGEIKQLTADHTLVAEQVRRGMISTSTSSDKQVSECADSCSGRARGR